MSVKAWVIKSRRGHLLPFTVMETRTRSIDAFLRGWWRDGKTDRRLWKQARKDAGWRCVKVEVKEVEK